MIVVVARTTRRRPRHDSIVRVRCLIGVVVRVVFVGSPIRIVVARWLDCLGMGCSFT